MNTKESKAFQEVLYMKRVLEVSASPDKNADDLCVDSVRKIKGEKQFKISPELLNRFKEEIKTRDEISSLILSVAKEKNINYNDVVDGVFTEVFNAQKYQGIFDQLKFDHFKEFFSVEYKSWTNIEECWERFNNNPWFFVLAMKSNSFHKFLKFLESKY